MGCSLVRSLLIDCFDLIVWKVDASSFLNACDEGSYLEELVSQKSSFTLNSFQEQVLRLILASID